MNGHDKVVHLLINHPQCNINEKDGFGRTALPRFDRTALHDGEYLNILVSVLINHHQCNLNETDKYGGTALHWDEYLNIFKLIILFILLFKAQMRGHQRIVDLIQSKTQNQTETENTKSKKCDC